MKKTTIHKGGNEKNIIRKGGRSFCPRIGEVSVNVHLLAML